jgi:hypothetical protein
VFNTLLDNYMNGIIEILYDTFLEQLFTGHSLTGYARTAHGGFRPGGRMRAARIVLVIFFLFGVSLNLNSQQASTTLQRDPQAVTLAQQSLAAMGGAQALAFTDCLAVGSVQSFKPDGTSVALPIVKKTKGTKMTRTEVQRPEGTRLRVVNGGTGAIQNPDGTIRRLFSNNTVAERIEHIPALSILSEWQSSNIEVRYVGTDTVNGSPAQVIALSFIPTSDPKWSAFYRSTTQTLFYIDQATAFVSKIQYQNFAENDSNVSEKIEIYFTNYRLVNGVQVPFTQTSYADGRLQSALTLSSVTFNTGLTDTDFSIPGGN